jgi:aryl-alcohol dehydrogenase-like predicted oxidoreductase
LKTDYVDLYQAHRYDEFTPLEETMEAFAVVVRSGKALYIGVSEWTPDQLRAGHALARELRIPFVSNQPQYNALYRIIEAEKATVCVRAALEAGITTFDTADVYANTKAEEILGNALAGERRESLEIFTKVYFPTGPKGPNDTGLSRKHIHESINGSLKRLRTDYVDLYQAHRYDHFTPLEETMEAFADVVRSGKALYIGVSEWTPDQLRAGHALARELRIPFVSNQPQYSALYRVIEDEVVPTSRELGISQVVFSPIAQGVLTGKYKPGQPVPEGSRATDPDGSAFIKNLLTDDTLTKVQQLQPLADAEGLTMAQLAVAWVLQNDNVATAITGGSRPEQITANAEAAGKKLSAETRAGIDSALGDAVQRDGSVVGKASPTRRLT